jgi:hypothetical protein
MKHLWEAAIAALAVGVAAGCTPYEGYYGSGYYGGGSVGVGYSSGGYYGGYCDSWGCPGDYWDMPVYYGSVYYNGGWVNGPFYYRDYNGGRQYWVHGGWRNDDWRGDRPSQYRNGRYGPALGREFYRNRGNDNRFDGNRTRNDGNRDGNRDRFNRGQQTQQQAQPQQVQPQQAQPQQDRGGRFGGRGFERTGSGPRDNGGAGSAPPPDRFQRDRPASPPPAGDGGGRFRGNRDR